jgi:hypothetical protein
MNEIPPDAVRIHLYPLKNLLNPRGGNCTKESLAADIFEKLIATWQHWQDPVYGDNPEPEALFMKLRNAFADECQKAWNQFVAALPPDGRVERERFWHRHGRLAVTRNPRSGAQYTHHCSLRIFEALLAVLEAAKGQPFVLEDLYQSPSLCQEPTTQIAVAWSFLKERGIIIPAGVDRANVVAPGHENCLRESALCEWHALYEEESIDGSEAAI